MRSFEISSLMCFALAFTITAFVGYFTVLQEVTNIFFVPVKLIRDNQPNNTLLQLGCEFIILLIYKTAIFSLFGFHFITHEISLKLATRAINLIGIHVFEEEVNTLKSRIVISVLQSVLSLVVWYLDVDGMYYLLTICFAPMPGSILFVGLFLKPVEPSKNETVPIVPTISNETDPMSKKAKRSIRKN